MNPPGIALSLIVPTRGRPRQLARFVESLIRNTRRPQQIELVLVVDDDDRKPDVRAPFSVNVVNGPPGRTMGNLNRAGFAASSGEHVMLLNDDVIARTRGWDVTVLNCFRRFPDPVALVHTNDTLIRDYLCTFPIVSRSCVHLMGGICPEEYERYRIDDHIEDPFNMLAHVGIRRSVYLPDVVFEHCNSVNHPTAGAVYESDPVVLARDAERFETMLPHRKATALRMLEVIEGRIDPGRAADIESIIDSFALRAPGRQQVIRSSRIRRAPKELLACGTRLRNCYQRAGFGGLANAAWRRLSHRQ